MARGPLLSNSDEFLITAFYDRHKTWTAKEIQITVSPVLRKTRPGLPPNWPGKSAVQRVLARVRKKVKVKAKEPDPQDRPWSIATLKDHPIPWDGLPCVMDVNKTRLLNKLTPLNIREATWAGRLSALIPEDPMWLDKMAEKYALGEYIADLMGIPFDSLYLDKALAGLELTKEEEVMFEIVGLSPEEVRHYRDSSGQTRRKKLEAETRAEGLVAQKFGEKKKARKKGGA